MREKTSSTTKKRWSVDSDFQTKKITKIVRKVKQKI